MPFIYSDGRWAKVPASRPTARERVAGLLHRLADRIAPESPWFGQPSSGWFLEHERHYPVFEPFDVTDDAA